MKAFILASIFNTKGGPLNTLLAIRTGLPGCQTSLVPACRCIKGGEGTGNARVFAVHMLWSRGYLLCKRSANGQRSPGDWVHWHDSGQDRYGQSGLQSGRGSQCPMSVLFHDSRVRQLHGILVSGLASDVISRIHLAAMPLLNDWQWDGPGPLDSIRKAAGTLG